MALPENFFNQVHEVVRLVPKGRVTTYGAIAKYLSAPSAARMVGYAMNAAHGVEPKVPAHRVVNRLGLLSCRAHFHPPEQMQWSLEEEGIKIKAHQVQNFDALFWDPTVELAM